MAERSADASQDEGRQSGTAGAAGIEGVAGSAGVEPQLIPRRERRFEGFDVKIIAMYARGMTVREIHGYLAEMYGVEASPEFISKVSDVVPS